MEFEENWNTIVKALEKIIPHYEEVNRYLSVGYAEKARTYAVNSRIKLRARRIVMG